MPAPTILMYMENMHQLQATATICELLPWLNDKQALILDKTVFYPQGGGQPYDTGIITHGHTTFKVEEVRFNDGFVYHIGTFKSGNLCPGNSVTLTVDAQNRLYNSRNHTAGHIVDIALSRIQTGLIPYRGYHFPQGAYVEYKGSLADEKREAIINVLQQEVDSLVNHNIPISVKLISVEELKQIARFVPDNLPKNKPTRAMIVENYDAIACGGTHVSNTAEVKKITIEKIKNKKGNVRISYSIDI